MIQSAAGDDKASTISRLRTSQGRRNFIRGLGLGAGAAVLGLAGKSATKAMAQSADLDVAILTFALNLEYLEAEYYINATRGVGLPPEEIGSNPGQVIGGSLVNFSDPTIEAYAIEIAHDEHKHVKFLRAALIAATGSCISRPEIDLTNSFVTLGQAAKISNKFNPYENDLTFLLGSYVFEDVGVTAYHGAAPLITSKLYLDKAAGILAVEAYHAGIIRSVLFSMGQNPATQAISAVRATLDGTIGTRNLDDFGVGTTTLSSLVVAGDDSNGGLLGGFPSDSPPGDNAIAFDRSTRQVLNIVYGAPNASKGLFFPSGLNGAIK
jgi:hypothetical protein